MADAPAPPPRPRTSIWTLLSFFLLIYILFINPQARILLGTWTGYALDPVIGFHHQFPVLTILLAGTLIVVGTTLLRHFTTDWLEVARTQAMMRHFQRELMKARKENNTYRMKLLGDKQPEVMAQQQKLQSAQLKQTPLTMLISIPIYAWLTTFLTALDNQAFAEPWNPVVTMNGRNGILPGLGSLFPHWILLSMALTIPLGLLVQRVMKYFAWRERWQKRHPDVHEGS